MLVAACRESSHNRDVKWCRNIDLPMQSSTPPCLEGAAFHTSSLLPSCEYESIAMQNQIPMQALN